MITFGPKSRSFFKYRLCVILGSYVLKRLTLISLGHVNILRWLFTHGGKVETDDLGGTPLHDAAEHGQLEVSTISTLSG